MGARPSLRSLARLSSAVVVLLAGGLITAQTVPRAPVIPVTRPGVAPTPTPVPDPTGIYQGQANVQVQGQAGSFTQTWRVELKAQHCPDCDPGQYYVHSVNYDGVLYANGRTERGGVYGTVSSSGTATDLGLYAINCRFLNPTDFRAAVPGATLYAGDQRGGGFGDPGGPKLTARGGLLAGHISGRDCFGQQVNAEVSLQRVSNFVQTCANRPSGTYIGSFANSCGGSGSGSITIRSVGCYFSGMVPDLVALEGNMTGPATAAVRLRLLDPCSGTASGSVNMNADGSIAGTFSGTSDGGFGCCPAGPVSGTFALTR